MGSVYWITGLSGAGKSTIGRIFYENRKKEEKGVVWLDGDELREAFGNDLGYSKEDRLKCAMRYSRICRLLCKQDLLVIICTISMFDSVREWNRKNIKNYHEVYVKVSDTILKTRNQKKLYSGAEKGRVSNVVGIDLKPELPVYPDLVLENDGKKPPQALADILEAYYKKDKRIQ